jgi:prepilin-type processing-associated H-X9-DG protein
MLDLDQNTWCVQLLPYIEQTNAYNTVVNALVTTGANPIGYGFIPTFMCPSQVTYGKVCSGCYSTRVNGVRVHIDVGLTTYVGLMNTDQSYVFLRTPVADPPKGTAYSDTFPGLDGMLIITPHAFDANWNPIPNTSKGLPITAVTDGTSNTIYISERGASLDLNWGWWGPANDDADNISPVFNTGTAAPPTQYTFPISVYTTDNGGTLAPKALCPLPAVFGPGTGGVNGCDLNHLWSPHTGGANFLFGDGHVQFLTYGITANNPGNTNPAAPTIIQALETRAGGENVTIPN